MADDAELIEKIRVREMVTDFINGQLGENLEARRAQDERIAVNRLLKLNPYEYDSLEKLRGAIAQIQENVILARKVNAYFADAILEGNEAEMLLDTQED